MFVFRNYREIPKQWMIPSRFCCFRCPNRAKRSPKIWKRRNRMIRNMFRIPEMRMCTKIGVANWKNMKRTISTNLSKCEIWARKCSRQWRIWGRAKIASLIGFELRCKLLFSDCFKFSEKVLWHLRPVGNNFVHNVVREPILVS